MNENYLLPPLYIYAAKLIRMFPFTHTVTSYICKWPEECRRRYNDPFLNKIAKETVADEKGHDKLILRDLEDLKIPLQIALDRFPSSSVQRCVSDFKKSVDLDPLHLLAWLLHAETQAVETVTKEVIESYQKLLGPYHKAVRFWKIHSAIGPDLEHAAKRKQWIEELPSEQKQIVNRELKRVAIVFSSQRFDLDFREFERFVNHHAPHLFDVAYKDKIKAMNILPFSYHGESR